MRLLPIVATIAAASLITACGGSSGGGSDSETSLDRARKVVNTNADIAYAAYSDAVDTAKALQNAIDELDSAVAVYHSAITTATRVPTSQEQAIEAALLAAKKAWLVAREPYGQTEVFRFRNSPIDSTDYESEDGPEGAINAWPLGEALIDYVKTGGDFGDDQIGAETALNTAGFPSTTNLVGVLNTSTGLYEVDASSDRDDNIIGQLTVEEIEADADEDGIADILTASEAGDGRDVISGYHAIEFMLWGQDLNDSNAVTNGDDRDDAVKTHDASTLATGGQRPYTDFTETTYGERRLAFLKVVAAKLVADLESVQAGWKKGASYRTAFTTINSEADAKEKLTEILSGMATLSQGELAGERMQIAFSDNSQEDEHSCFSDNTHRDIWLNAEGVSNSFYGKYDGYDSTLDGRDDAISRKVDGYGLDDYLNAEGQTTLVTELTALLNITEEAYRDIDEDARAGEPVDVQIMEAKNNMGTPMADTIIALTNQANKIAEIADQLGIDGDDVLDPDGTACTTTDPTSSCD